MGWFYLSLKARVQDSVPVPKLAASRSRKIQFSVEVQGQEKAVFQFKVSETRGILSYLREGQSSCSTQVFGCFDETLPYQGKQLALLGLPTEKLISPQNTLTETLRIMFDHISGHPVAQSS